MRALRSVLPLLIVAALPLGRVAGGEDAKTLEALAGQAKRTLAQALEAGLAAAGSGVAFHAELERDKGRAVYSVDVAQATKTFNAVLDAADGSLIEKDVDDEDHSAAVRAAKLTLAQAVAAAAAAHPGRPVEAQLTLAGGSPVVRVRLLDAGKVVAVLVDAVSGAVTAEAGPAAPADDGFTRTFAVAAAEWASRGSNPWFSLEPGVVLVLEGQDEGEAVRLTITVLDETLTVDGVETRVVEEREEAGGKPKEVSRNYFALSTRTNDVYYFGEDVDVYEEGKVVRHDGAWRSGAAGARFGLMMPGTPLLGARHYQEVAPGTAMDRAEVKSLTGTLVTAAGAFEGCLVVEETTPLEEGKEQKVYARGVGLVKDGPLTLVKRTAPK